MGVTPTQIVVCRAYRKGWSWCDWYPSWGTPDPNLQSVGWGAKDTVTEAIADAETQGLEIVLTEEAEQQLLEESK